MMIDSFFSPTQPSLKICGITQASDAHRLVELGVHALGINFWERSKRYCSPELAVTYAPAVKGQILRVGVFVNASAEYVLRCFEQDLIDVAQFHGDETNDFLADFSQHNLPFIKALGVSTPSDLVNLDQFSTPYLLLDAHAPGVYGGTGETIDWALAGETIKKHPALSIMLAGGLTPDNARLAAQTVSPCALDIASGAESSPGIKDFDKVSGLLQALQP